MSSSHVDVVSMLLTHARLQSDGFSLRTVRFDTKPRATGRIIVGLVWRRRWDREAEIRHATLTAAQAQELLLGLGRLSAL